MTSSVVVIFISLCIATASFSSVATARVPAIFVFGDSLADVGNNNFLPTVSTSKSDFPHNGIDFPGHRATGRFSNGFNTIDLLAKYLGFRQSPPAILSISNQTQILPGANFASGGSGILDTTGTNILTFTIQIDKFKNFAANLTTQRGNESTSRLLADSVFLISAGSNDVFAYYSEYGPSNETKSQEFVANTVAKLEDHLRALYRSGGRKFGVVGISHIGCIPLMRNLDPNGECAEELNRMARIFNEGAKDGLHNMQSELEGFKYSYGNSYDVMSIALAKPSTFGYTDVTSACCGSGKFNGAASCTPNATYCENRTEHLFWDRYHPTQTTSFYLAKAIYGGSPRFASPINIKLLAQ